VPSANEHRRVAPIHEGRHGDTRRGHEREASRRPRRIGRTLLLQSFDRNAGKRCGPELIAGVRAMTSVLSERHYWADPGRAPRGQGTACACHADKDRDREPDRREVVRIDAEEKR
jgi:hypothetical protein